MSNAPVVLVVCFPVSIHAARWVNMLRRSPFRAVVFPSVLQAACPEFEPSLPVRNRTDIAKLKEGEIGWFAGELIESVANSAEDRRRQYQPMRSCVDVVPEWLPSPESLLKAIDVLKPDLLHSLELQHGAYLCLEADRRRPGVFPPWIVSNWGSDVYLYRKLSAHRPVLEALFRRIDGGFHSDCERDVSLARELGFRGAAFPAMPASGGIDLNAYPDPAKLPPPSKRRMILVKGYHGWAGRGLHILLAIHRIAPQLKEYQIRVTHCGSAMRAMAAELAREDGLDVVVDPYYAAHYPALERLAQARVVVGCGISDGISTSLLEAMTVGTFCIQANTACGCEWIEPGVTGLIVPPHDVQAMSRAILKAATDDALVDNAVTPNRETIRRRWSAEAVRPLVIESYQKALAAAGAVRA